MDYDGLDALGQLKGAQPEVIRAIWCVEERIALQSEVIRAIVL